MATDPAWTTCESCRTMFSDFTSLKQAFSEPGYDHIVDRDTFRSAVEQNCGLCSAFHELAGQGDLADIQAQALFDPEDLEGIDEDDYKSMEPFRVNECTREDDQRTLCGQEKLVRNIHFEVMSGRARYDATSVRVAAWSAENRFHLDLEFDLWSDEDDPAGMFVRTRPRNPNVSSDARFLLAKEWISECVTRHDICPKPRMTLPTRIIDVGTDKDTIRLARGCDVGQAFYAALSYVWGGPQPITLTRATSQSMFSNIDVLSLPQTIQDAVTSTRKVGLQYLWIDAMCIFQDDPADKEHEIARMDDIYHNAYVTICAASATKCQVGSLENKGPEFQGVPPCAQSRINFPCPNRRLGQVELTTTRTYDPIMEPTNSRAWCYQERLLSPRVLTYGSWQMYWQCQSRQYCDGGDISRFEQAGTERLSMFAFTAAEAQPELQSTDVSNNSRRTRTMHANWLSVLQEYNLRDVTDPQDKLPALAGIAKRYGQALPGDRYCAGLWESQLIPTLAWQNGNPQSSRPKTYCAPTWSWASVLGEVFWGDDAMQTGESKSANVKSCVVMPATSGTLYGRVQGGSLVVEGTTRLMDWDGTLHENQNGTGWSIHPDVFCGQHLSGSSQLFDDFFDELAKSDSEVRYDVSLHLSSGQQTTTNDGKAGQQSAPIMTVLCLRITDITALVLDLDSRAGIDQTLAESFPNKRRKLLSGEFNVSESTSVPCAKERTIYKRIGLMVFQGAEGIDDADAFFQNCSIQDVIIT